MAELMPHESMNPKSLLANMAPSTVTAMIAVATERKTAGDVALATSCTAGSAVNRPAPNQTVEKAVAPTARDAPKPRTNTFFIIASAPFPSLRSTSAGSFVWLS